MEKVRVTRILQSGDEYSTTYAIPEGVELHTERDDITNIVAVSFETFPDSRPVMDKLTKIQPRPRP